MSIVGGCLCGEVRYEVSAPLKNARACHCSRCRKAFSSASSAYAEVTPGTFRWTRGEHQITRYATHPPWGLAFCRHCGSTLAGLWQKDVHGITLGSVDGDPGIEISMHIFVDSKAPWDHIGGDAPHYAEHPSS
ncbi:MAG: GFA family protein [Gammaproteobacteria bacterium]